MKIIQVMPEFGLAGAETMCENLTYELIKLGHEVVIISLYDFHSAITERLEKQGIKIVYLNKKHGFDLSIFRKLRKVFQLEKPDVIHTHRYVMIYTVPASLWLHARRVHTVHNIADKEVSEIYSFFYNLFYKINGVIPVALTELIQKSIIEKYHLKKERIPIVFNGVDLSKCIVKKNYSLNDKFVVLNIARFNIQKNHTRLLTTFKILYSRHTNAELWMIGDGDQKEHIEHKVRELNISESVKFLGIQSDVYQYINKADVFVLSSDYEGMPMTLVEAMGTGLPIVTTNVGGIQDMIKDGHSGLLTSLDSKDLANSIEAVYESENLRRELGTNALSRSALFSSAEMARKYSKVYGGEL